MFPSPWISASTSFSSVESELEAGRRGAGVATADFDLLGDFIGAPDGRSKERGDS